MKRIFFQLVTVALLALSACAPPAGVGTTQRVASDQVATIVAATMAAHPTDTPEALSQDQGELTFRVVKQMGGTFDAVAVDGDTVYLGIGARFSTVDISDPTAPRLLWQSEVLTDRPAAIAAQSGMAYVRIGDALLIYDVSDPNTPALVSTLSGVDGDLFAVGDFVYTFAPGSNPEPLIVIDVSDPAHPARVARHELAGPAALAVSGDVLYLTSGGRAPNDVPAPGTFQLIQGTQFLS